MEAIIECLQAYKATTSANPIVAAIVTNATIMTTIVFDVVVAFETSIETMVQSVVSQTIF